MGLAHGAQPETRQSQVKPTMETKNMKITDSYPSIESIITFTVVIPACYMLLGIVTLMP